MLFAVISGAWGERQRGAVWEIERQGCLMMQDMYLKEAPYVKRSELRSSISIQDRKIGRLLVDQINNPIPDLQHCHPPSGGSQQVPHQIENSRSYPPCRLNCSLLFTTILPLIHPRSLSVMALSRRVSAKLFKL